MVTVEKNESVGRIALSGETIGTAFRNSRKAHGLSGEALASLTDLSRRTIIKIEQGDESVAFGSYRSVAQALELDWLIDVFSKDANHRTNHRPPRYYLSGATALSLPPEDGRPPALWYSSSLSNPKSWKIAGKHLTHTGDFIGVMGLWNATEEIRQYGVTAPCIWAASPERAVYDLLIHHCEIQGKTIPNIQASDIDDVVDLKKVIEWVKLCRALISTQGERKIKAWLEDGYR